MDPEMIIVLLVQILTLLGYFLTAKYQSRRIETLEQSMQSQRDLLKNQADTIKTFDDYKKLINLNDVEKNINLKLDNLHLEYKKIINQREKTVSDSAIKIATETFQRENHKMLRAWNELVNINAQFIIGEYPDKLNVKERDEFINRILPFNAEYLIPMINAWQSEDLEKFKQENPISEFLSDDDIPRS